jgi:predicted O-linked N-acetylglucosamine transferase (SPINDLY family)
MENELRTAYEHFKKGNYAAAWELCQYILKTTPTQPDSLAMLGMMCNKAKRYADAEKYLRKCLFFHPNRHIILTELATSLAYLEKYDEAEKMLAESMGINSKYDKTYIQLGKLFKLTGKKAEAEKMLRKLLAINPLSTAAMNNLGTLLMEENKQEEALQLFKKGVEINPRMGMAHKNIALIELEKGNKNDAETHLSIASNFLPDDTEVLVELGKLYASQSLTQKAIFLAEKVLEKEPENIEMLLLAGSSHRYVNEFEKAITYFERALKVDENLSPAFYMMARCKTDLCDWENWDGTREKFIGYLENDIKDPKYFECSTYDTHYYNIPDELQYQLMLRVAENYKLTTPSTFSFKNRSHNRLRIGYISPDFRHHALGMSVYHLFQHHDRERFETFAFSLVTPKEPDFFHEKIKTDVEHFHDISKCSYTEAAQLIYDCEVDILVDFGGYTNHTKPEILAIKPAPVQIFMMGQPDTTGSPKYDFFVSDSLLIDEVNRKHYTEKILFLPHGFICSPITPSEKIITCKEMGIADDAFVFCSFCSPYKYEPKLFEMWMRILNEVENSVLWLLGIPNQSFQNNIKAFVEKHGVDPNRIKISDYVPIEEHLSRFNLCDLFLDTLYYSSCSSGSHALMMGVPVLTLYGETNAMRQGASVCHAAGLDETICYSMEEYFNVAVDLANSPEKLDKLKNKLPVINPSNPHFDIKKDVGYMEKAYLQIWEIFLKGEKFTDIHID